MADSLVLKGVKDVRKHTGTEMQLVIPRRGGNTHQIKQWWRNGVNTPYCACTLFRVTTSGGTIYLALETGSSEKATVKITHDGDGNFTFSHISQLKRAALYNESRQIIEHYAFPSIVNGPIVKTIPPGAVQRPVSGKALGTVAVTGPTDTTVGPHSYSATVSDSEVDSATLSYAWSISPSGSVSGSGASVFITVPTGNSTITCEITSSDGEASPASSSGQLNVTAVVAPIIGNVVITGNQTPNEGDTEPYTVATPDATAGNLTYQRSGGPNVTIQGNATGTTADFLIASGSSTIECLVTSGDSGVNGNPAQGTLSINPVVLFANLVSNADYSYVVTVANGVYELDGAAQPALTGNAGDSFYFDLSDASLSGHPFKIYTDASKTTEVTVGIEQQGTDLVFTPPIAGTFSYQCGSHAAMGGDITVNA